MDSGLLTNFILSLLTKRIIIPSDFGGQCTVIKQMLKDDITGLTDVLTDFAVQSAKVDFSIEANNDKLNDIFKKWLDTVNIEVGAVPIGIKAIAEEYFKERWKASSFCVLKIAKWEKMDGSDLILPTKMFIVDGSSIRAQEVDEADENLKLGSYKYYIGNNEENKYLIKSDSSVTNRPYSRWFDKYPTPYLIKRGIYHNYKIIESLKTRQTEILDQIIPYLLLIKKGTEGLATSGTKVYSNPELQEVIGQMQELMDDMKATNYGDKNVKSPIRATNFDEDIKHLIPDVGTMFKTELFEQAERNILSGLGFVDIVQGVSSTRREATLNPKAFIQEINSGVESFKEMLTQLLVLIKIQNESHIKYNSTNLYVCSSPIKGFMTDEFKDKLRLLYTHGGISKRTYTELVGEVDYDTEKFRRERESKSGDEYIMYPPITQNMEDKGIDVRGDNPDEDNESIPVDKQTDKEKYNYSSTEDEVTPYELINSFDEEIILEEGKVNTKVRTTEQYLRYRQIEPNKFEKDSFRVIVISPSKKIKAIVGKLIGEKTTTIQSYLFLKKKWSNAEAKNWLNENAEEFNATVNKFDLVTSPYTTLTSLPDYVKKWSIEKQQAWRQIWNQAFRYMLGKSGNIKVAETYAFRTANARIKMVKSNEGFFEKLGNYFKKK